MAGLESNIVRPDFTTSSRRDGGGSITRSLHSLLDMLAKMDLEYEEKRHIIDCSCCDAEMKRQILKKFKDRHRAKRGPYLQQLVLLQGQIKLD